MAGDDFIDREQSIRGDLAALGEDLGGFGVEVDQHWAARSRRQDVHRLPVAAVAAGRRGGTAIEVDDYRRPFDRHVERNVERRVARVGVVEQIHPERPVLEQQPVADLIREVLPLRAQPQR